MRKSMWHMEIREEVWSAQRRVGSNQIEMRGDWSNWSQMITRAEYKERHWT